MFEERHLIEFGHQHHQCVSFHLMKLNSELSSMSEMHDITCVIIIDLQQR